MREDLPLFELKKVLQLDALDLIAAHDRGKVLHRTRDISASGDEVEIAFRALVKRKLPTMYYVGHGHVVDVSWRTSPQFDVIIADNSGAPILFRSQKGSEYFPYESVYALGEVKSTYYKGTIHNFSERLTVTKSTLRRSITRPTDTGLGFGFSMPITSDPYRNPLFSFMIFISSNGFDIEDIRELYLSGDPATLPNLICFLDSGVVVNAKVSYSSSWKINVESINNIPEFHRGFENGWCFLPMGELDYREGSTFGFLYFALVTHLKNCKLQSPDLLAYLQPILTFDKSKVLDFNPPSQSMTE